MKCPKKIKSDHSYFWTKYPALLFGISLLIGTSSFLYSAPFYSVVWALYLVWQKKWAAILLTLLGIFYAFAIDINRNSLKNWEFGKAQDHMKSFEAKLTPPKTNFSGYFGLKPPISETGYFSISSLKPYQSPFKKGLLYQGVLYIENQKLPCSVYHSSPKARPSADKDYIIRGSIQQRGPYDYLFKAKKWTPVPQSWSFAEKRYQMKRELSLFLEKKLKRKRVATLLGSLLTGDVTDRSLRYEFGRLGLQHILAVSGFHFAILIGFCSFFLNFFLPKTAKYLTLLILINLYFLFVGSVPAVQRSWLVCLFFLIGKLIGRNSSGLNLLGTALLIEVLIDPLSIRSIGFQLSFTSCLGILLLFPSIHIWMERIFPKHKPSSLSLFAQHGLIVTTFLRGAFALSCAVNAAILPILLYHFHSYPLLALIYNLFIPLLISISLFLLLLSIIVHFIYPALALPLFNMTNFLTSETLDLIAYPPLLLDFSVRLQNIPLFVIPIYLFALIFWGAQRKQNLLQESP